MHTVCILSLFGKPSRKLLASLGLWFFSVFVVSAFAQHQPARSAEETAAEESRACELTRKVFGYPYYYCDCSEDNTVTFQFGMDMEISDTIWFSATIPELKQGLSAYWFSTKGIRLELYALCSSTAPTMSITVGGNTMREMDINFINQKLEEMGNLAEMAESVMNPHLRVYPLNGGSGHVMAYPYDEGPHSTCDNLLPVVHGMTYVSNHDEDVYALAPSAIRKNQQMYVQWKQKDNQPCQLRITRGTCDGEPVLTKQLRDSTKLFFPSVDWLNEVKTAGDTLFFHFSHRSEDVGRIRFRYNPKWDTLHVDTTFCEGRVLQLADTALSRTTFYGPDTVWFRNDTMLICTYNVEVLSTDPSYDTLTLYQRQLPYYYRNAYYVNRMGEHHVTIHRDGLCDEKVELTIYHRTDSIKAQKSTEECEGRSITMAGKTYSKDTVLTYSEWRDADTWQDVTHTLSFSKPVMEYDTVAVYVTELPYYYADANKYVPKFGNHTFTIKRREQCTRLVQLTLEEIPVVTEAESPVNDENKPRKIIRNGMLYILHDGIYRNLLGQEIEN